MYDAQLGRFHTQDRFAEKYNFQSPYAYAANNPIKYIDVNGDSLWIQTSDGNLLWQNNKLYSKGKNGSLSIYKGKLAKLNKDGNVKRYKGILGTTVKALNKLGGSDYANNILSSIQNSSHSFTIMSGYKKVSRIQVNLGNGKTGFLNNNAYATQVLEQGKNIVSYAPFNNIGSGGRIYWNPNDGFIALGHESGHAYDAINGELDARRVSINGGIEVVREIKAVYHENRIRQDLGMKLRKNYSGGPRLIDSNNNPIYYQTQTLPKLVKRLLITY